MVEFFYNTNLGITLLVTAEALLVIVLFLVALAFLMYADGEIGAAASLR